MTENEWIPIKWLPLSKVFIAKIRGKYQSTENQGWRMSTEREIMESGW